jgi:hypothetical protein
LAWLDNIEDSIGYKEAEFSIANMVKMIVIALARMS